VLDESLAGKTRSVRKKGLWGQFLHGPRASFLCLGGEVDQKALQKPSSRKDLTRGRLQKGHARGKYSGTKTNPFTTGGGRRGTLFWDCREEG